MDLEKVYQTMLNQFAIKDASAVFQYILSPVDV